MAAKILVALIFRALLLLLTCALIWLSLKTAMLKNLMTLQINKGHIVFFSLFIVVSYFALFPRKFMILLHFFRQQWKYCLFLVVFTVAVFEISLRLLFPDKYLVFSKRQQCYRFLVNGQESHSPQIYQNSREFSFTLKPNINIYLVDKQDCDSQDPALWNEHIVKTNELGFRFQWDDDNPDKPPIMFLGDSVTYGWGINEQESYPYQIGQLLNDQYQILNFGIGGWGFGEYYAVFKKYYQTYHPELVVIGIFPANDFGDLLHTTWQTKAQGDLPYPPLARDNLYIDDQNNLRHHYSAYEYPILRELKSFIFFDYIAITPFMFSWEALREKSQKIPSRELALKIIAAISKEVPVLALILPHNVVHQYERDLPKFIEGLRTLPQVTVLDLHEDLRSQDQSLAYVDDGGHLSPMGGAIVAKKALTAIVQNKLLLAKNSQKTGMLQ